MLAAYLLNFGNSFIISKDGTLWFLARSSLVIIFGMEVAKKFPDDFFEFIIENAGYLVSLG